MGCGLVFESTSALAMSCEEHLTNPRKCFGCDKIRPNMSKNMLKLKKPQERRCPACQREEGLRDFFNDFFGEEAAENAEGGGDGEDDGGDKTNKKPDGFTSSDEYRPSAGLDSSEDVKGLSVDDLDVSAKGLVHGDLGSSVMEETVMEESSDVGGDSSKDAKQASKPRPWDLDSREKVFDFLFRAGWWYFQDDEEANNTDVAKVFRKLVWNRVWSELEKQEVGVGGIMFGYNCGSRMEKIGRIFFPLGFSEVDVATCKSQGCFGEFFATPFSSRPSTTKKVEPS